MKTYKNLHPNSKIDISLEDVVRIEADINYSHLILNSGQRIILARTLKAYEKDLSFPFLRVNKSFIINVNFLDEMPILDKKVMMKDGKIIPISRRRVERVEKAIALKLA
ncbi:MAG: LytTR family transcriptional regulator [Microscillaceae bacterium]|jgi:two-component system LytT family response regulator|nr:LytTR family transcriptional regulator [Microscillaceae bacterium]